MRSSQSGIMLLEALIAILIFSLGILGVVGMQAAAVRANRDAQYRTEASLLASDLAAQMISGNRNGAALQAAYQGDDDDALGTSVLADGPQFIAWRTRVQGILPGAAANAPRVTVVPGVIGPPQTGSQVEILVRWQPPNEAVAHSYRLVVQII